MSEPGTQTAGSPDRRGDWSFFGLSFWSEWIWLLYVAFWFIVPATEPSERNWLLLILALALFVPMYVIAHSKQRSMLVRCVATAGVTLLAIVYVPMNTSAFGIYIFIAATLPEIAEEGRIFNGLLAAELAIILVQAYFAKLASWEWGPAVAISVMIALNLRYYHMRQRADARLRMANDEIEHLAKTAERERIARDLHDVLGHTLSLIAVKSELASRLLAVNPERAAVELGEIEATARRALSDVRQTVSGYRAQGLEREIQEAGAMLAAAGVALSSSPRIAKRLDGRYEAMFCLLLREATTNIVRHARAHSCSVELRNGNDGSVELIVQDDGRGYNGYEGNGLTGMRERLREFHGTLTIASAAGRTQLTARVPAMHPAQEADTQLAPANPIPA